MRSAHTKNNTYYVYGLRGGTLFIGYEISHDFTLLSISYNGTKIVDITPGISSIKDIEGSRISIHNGSMWMDYGSIKSGFIMVRGLRKDYTHTSQGL